MTNCPPLDLNDVDEAECKAEFRVTKQHLPQEQEHLKTAQLLRCLSSHR